MLLGLPLISAIARPRQVRKLPRCESGGGRVLCPYYSCLCRRATTAMPEISEFRFAPDSPAEGGGFEPSVPHRSAPVFEQPVPSPIMTGPSDNGFGDREPKVRILLPPAASQLRTWLPRSGCLTVLVPADRADALRQSSASSTRQKSRAAVWTGLSTGEKVRGPSL